MALSLDSLLDLELEARIVGIVMTTATNLEDHAGVAFVSERKDRAESLRRLADVIAPGTVAGLASDSCEIGVG